ncbi:hypothetical protein GCM10022258_20830 [Aquimarina gracilis]
MITAVSGNAQPFNKEVTTSNNRSLLLGKINKQGLSQAPYGQWFQKNYNQYAPKKDVIETIKNQLNQYTITVFMGTWCGDSKREVPAFYKVLDSLNFPAERITVVAVNNERNFYKQSPGGEHEGLNIHRVPTFIFYKDSKEVNRIVESPKATLEEDILQIVSNKYISNYSSVTAIDEILKEHDQDYLFKKSKKLISEFKEKTQNMYELNTYANVLFFAHKYEEAIAVLKFNLMLFPEEANAHVSLANKYLYLNDETNAIKYYEKSLKFADNEEIQSKIKELRIASNQE